MIKKTKLILSFFLLLFVLEAAYSEIKDNSFNFEAKIKSDIKNQLQDKKTYEEIKDLIEKIKNPPKHGKKDKFWFSINPLNFSTEKAIEKERVERINKLKESYKNDVSRLHIAIYNKDYQLAEQLIGYGLDINVKFQHLYTPLSLAILGQDTNIIELLLRKGADCDGLRTNSDFQNVSSLIEACSTDNKEIINIIISKTNKVDANCKNLEKNISITPLQYLCQNYSSEKYTSIEELLTKGANCGSSFKNYAKDTVTPLYYAIFFQDKKLIDLLLQSISKKDKNDIDQFLAIKDNQEYKGSLLGYAVWKAGNDKDYYKEIIEKLEYNGANIQSNMIIDNERFNIYNYLEKMGIYDELFMKNLARTLPQIDDLKDSKPEIQDAFLKIAIERVNIDFIKAYIEKKYYIGNAIFSAIDKGSTELLRKLLNTKEEGKGDNISKWISFPDMPSVEVDPLIYAAIKEDIPVRDIIIEILFENRNKFAHKGFNDRITKDGKSPILLITDEDIIIKLFEYDKEVNYYLTDNEKKNVIDYAFEKNQTFVIEWLWKNEIPIGASVFSAIDSELNGKNSHIEEFISFDESIKKITKKVEYNNQNIECGPIVYSVLKNEEMSLSQNRIKILRKLIEKKCNLNETVIGGDYNGCTALIFATMCNNSDVAKFLLGQEDIDILLQDKGVLAGRNALFYAIEKRNFDIANLIINKLESNKTIKDFQLLNEKDKKATLLMFIAQYGDFSFVKENVPKIIKQDKSILESRDRNGWTPFLYAAAYNPDSSILRVLRQYGAKCDVVDKNNNNAFKIAEFNKNSDEVKNRLKDYGVF